MSKSITPNQIKQYNRQLIYQYIYKNKYVSQQDLVFNLHLSRPTVATNIAELEEQGLIRKGKALETEYAGRKAIGYEIVPDHKISVGLHITAKQIKMLYNNLYGESFQRVLIDLDYENTPEYIQKVCELANDYIASLDVNEDQVLGIGITLPGLVSVNGDCVTYGKILDNTGLSIKSFHEYLNYPCRFFHDATSAATSELWHNNSKKNFMYLMINNHLGAAMIHKRKILVGRHGHSGTIEHICVEPNGKTCYCGNVGCMETVCSTSAFLQENEKLEDFFKALRSGDPEKKELWNTFLYNLSRSINTLHLVYDTTYIIGGYIAQFMEQDDIEVIYDNIEKMTPFEEARDFIYISAVRQHNITIGAALPYIQKFLEENTADY